MGLCSWNGSWQTDPGTGALRCCKCPLGMSTPALGTSHGAGRTTACIYRHVALPGSRWGMFSDGHEKNQKRLLRGEFREFTRGREHLTLQSYRFEVRLLLTASIRSLPREQPRYLKPWALTMGKPKPGVCKPALKLKRQHCALNMGGMCLLLQHQSRCLWLPNR